MLGTAIMPVLSLVATGRPVPQPASDALLYGTGMNLVFIIPLLAVLLLAARTPEAEYPGRGPGRGVWLGILGVATLMAVVANMVTLSIAFDLAAFAFLLLVLRKGRKPGERQVEDTGFSAKTGKDSE